MYESYSKVQEIRNISQIVGEDDLSDVDKSYLEFGKEFENRFLSQDAYDNRSLEESLDLGWDILKILPIEEIHRVSSENKEKFLGAKND